MEKFYDFVFNGGDKTGEAEAREEYALNHLCLALEENGQLRESFATVADFLDSIEGAGYGGMATFENARAIARLNASTPRTQEPGK